MSKLTYAFLIFISLSFALKAQDLNLKFRHLTVDNGMPHTDVTSIVQDAKGFVWLGTYAGLCRYDGYEIRTYLNSNNQLKRVYHNRINGLAIGRDGLIWLATQSGLVVFDPKKEQFINVEGYAQYVGHVATDTEGGVYAAIGNQIVGFRLDKNKQIQKIDFENFDGQATVLAFKMDSKKGLWATCTEGVLKIKNAGQNRLVERISVQDENKKQYSPSSIFFDQLGNMILGVRNGYVIVKQANLERHQNTFVGQFVALSPTVMNMSPDQNFTVNSMTEDVKNGSIWIGSENGIAQLADWASGRVLQKITGKTQPNVSSDHISQLFIDRAGCLWVTTYGGGADILDLNRKKFYSIRRDEKNPQKSMTDDYARALLEDDNGNLWIGTRSEGINIVNLKTNEWRFLRHIDNSNGHISSNKIRSLSKDKQGRIWIGSDAGLDIYDGSRFTKISAAANNPNSLSANAIFSIDKDVFGQMWAGSWDNGVNCIRYQSANDYQIERIVKGEKGLCGSKVSFVFADPQRPEVFVATTEGLNHIFLEGSGEVAKIYHYKGIEGNSKTLNSDFIWPIVRTDAKTLWVGTLGGGLNKITLLGEGKYEAEHITTANGLPSNDIESLLTDAQGNLWLGGKGLTLFNTEKNEVVNFDVNDGLQSNVFKIGSACAGRDGRLYFGGIKGVTYFHPDSILRNKQAAKAILTTLTVNNQVVKVGTKYEGSVVLQSALEEQSALTFNHLQKTITLHFSTLQYANPDKYRYRYQLVGFDKNWIETDASQRWASYSNLDAGDYTFRFMASNSDGFWEEVPSEIKIQILPPWWASFWAKLIYTLIGLGLAYGAWSWAMMRRNLHIQRIEERKSEELHQLRLQFFTNISHELRTPLSLITAPIEKLIDDPALPQDKKLHHYDLIQRNAQRLLNLVNELLEFRKVESGTRRLRATQTNFPAFVRSICEEFEEVAEKRDIHFNINLPEKIEEPIWLDRAVVEKVIVNLLSNAFKYTRPAGSITVDLAERDEAHFKNEMKLGHENGLNTEGGVLWLRIADTGVGLAETELQQVFDRFYRVTDSEQDMQPGSGIGLAFVRSLMALHRGCISVYSEKEKGTEFYIGLQKGKNYLKSEELLVADETSLNTEGVVGMNTSENVIETLYDVETAHLNQKQKASGKPKMLIVEDNDELRQFLAGSFADQYHITVAEDGEAGLDAAKESQPEVIITDIMMPKMDGASS
jgi:signal transduction histidine kinase